MFKYMDDEQNQALNQEPVQTQEQSPTPKPEVQSDTKPETGEVKDEGRSAKSRIQEVIADKKEVTKENEQLKGLLNRIDEISNQPMFPNSQGLQPNEKGEVTAEQIIGEAQNRAANTAYLVAQQQRAVDTLRKETADIEKDYPELNPDSDKYDKDLSEAVATAVESQVKVLAGYDPKGNPIYAMNTKASPKAIVAKMMKPYRKSLTQAQAKVEADTQKQVAETAMRPTPTVPHIEKSAEDMSIKELEKKLGIIC